MQQKNSGMKIPDFDTFYNELTSDEIWFESIKMTHLGKDSRESTYEFLNQFTGPLSKFISL